MARVLAALWLGLTIVGAGEPARAQEAARQLDVIVLRPAPGLERLAERTAELAQRTGLDCRVGGPPPPGVVEAVPEGHVGMIVADGKLTLVLGAGRGVTYATEMELPARAHVAAARAVALAVESLRVAALAAPRDDGQAGEEGRVTTHWVHGWRFVGEIFPDVQIEPLAKPTLYLRTLVGVSPVRGTLLLGFGTGLGLCVTAHCVVLEGDLPLLAEERSPAPDTTVSYRAVTFSTRFQYRPFRFGDLIPGGSFGLMTRIGNATILETRATKVVTNLGLRGTLELAWRFVERFEAVLEGGVDFAISRAEFIRGSGDALLLEDRWTPWIVASLRLRP